MFIDQYRMLGGSLFCQRVIDIDDKQHLVLSIKDYVVSYD